MKHSIKNPINGRFTKQIIVEETKPIKPVPVVQIVTVLVLIRGILIALDKFNVIDLF